jgi:hypothetical protein
MTMPERSPQTDSLRRRGRPPGRGRSFRIALNSKLTAELEHAAAVRGLNAERLLSCISRTVIGGDLIRAVLDDDER